MMQLQSLGSRHGDVSHQDQELPVDDVEYHYGPNLVGELSIVSCSVRPKTQSKPTHPQNNVEPRVSPHLLRQHAQERIC